MVNGKRIIVSMTSWKKRIHNVAKVVYSIYMNSVKPDKIELNLSSDEFINKEADLPEELMLLVGAGILTINWVKENTGVFKKFIPVLKKYKNEDFYLFSCDDDWLYNKDYVDMMINRLGNGNYYSLQNPKHVVGNSTVYQSKLFKENFETAITPELIKIGISDYYITQYLTFYGYKQPTQKHNKIYDFAKPFNQVFPNSQNKTNGNGNYDSHRVSAAVKETDKIIKKLKL